MMKYQHIIQSIWRGNVHYGCLKSQIKCSLRLMHSINKYTHNATIKLDQVSRSHSHAAKLIGEAMENGSNVLFYTKNEYDESLIKSKAAQYNRIFFIFRKWMNGLLSNFISFRFVINKFKIRSTGDKAQYTKKEWNAMSRAIDLKKREYEGILEMNNKPSIVVLASYSPSAIKEANKAGIPCVIWTDGSIKMDQKNIYIFANNNHSSLKLLCELIDDYFQNK